MNADSHYIIGSSHQYCQDYTRHGQNEKYAWGIVCDGCSGSTDSDVGARLLAHMAEKVLKAVGPKEIDVIQNALQVEFQSILDYFGNSFSFDSTLLLMVYDKSKNVLHFYIWGDGHYYVKKKNGEAFFGSIIYSNGAPFYLSYRWLNKEDEYETCFGSNYAEWTDEFFQNGVSIESGKAEGVKRVHFVIDNAASTIEFVSITSDGLSSIEGGNLLEFFNFKSFNGDFVKRRFTGFSRYLKKNQLFHTDDLSMAAISFV